MIVLDTNIVSEGFRFGISLLEHGTRRATLQTSADRLEFDRFAERILPFDAVAATAYGELRAARQRSGRPIGPIDGFIAAIAIAHDADIAARDVDGFSGLGLTIVNPFDFIA